MHTLQSDTGRLHAVALRHVRDAFVDQAQIDRQWRELNYLAAPDFTRAVDEYERFAALLQDLGAEIHWLPPDADLTLDALYARDAAIVCERGVILCSMGKDARRDEPELHGRALEALGVPILGAISGEGRLEGGDVAWIDERTLAVGRGYRTNDEGIRQLRELLGDSIDELVVVPLPHWKGPADVFHLMSIYSPIAPDLALVYSPLMPIPFREALLARGIGLVEVPDEEFESQGCNCLAMAPRVCVLPAGNPVTRRRLEAAGAEVHTFEGAEICVHGGGGPTCLTRPLARERR